ncbi:biopolymer transporter ExbD [Mucilaginibacter sp. SMC90]|uniref:biopolymer transporter ExbD n=1 Tax=Mucilaginibacter sp. SMC90 TaxID=2929803 RepID=UPI001FB513FB|nr:biopolymer transporter ExbD [Mucilaginibacter sp. SMC90]UOE49589.1 biopolymer transporter ExbD [Mucilaginibacter sp. SMC90]
MYQTTSRRKHFSIDTSALCDVAFLLLCFFIFAWKRVDPVQVNVPLSTYYGCQLGGGNEGVIIITQHKIMFSLFPSGIRQQTLKQIGESYHVPFSSAQLSEFAKMDYIGVPVYELKEHLTQYDPLKSNPILQPGIPIEKGNNDLANWIYESKKASLLTNNQELRFFIKADEKTEYPVIKKVIRILQDQGINKFSLLTNLKQTNYE